MNNLLYLYKNPTVGTHSVVRTLFSIATQYTSYSILRLWRSQTLLLSISELEQNLHDCRQLPITWTLLEVVTLGPFEIVKKVGNSAYRLKLPRSMSRLHPVFNVVKLLPAPSDPIPGRLPQPPPPPEIISGEEE